MLLKVQCPNDSKQCVVSGGEIQESMLLLGDQEQNMQCLHCGFASNASMKNQETNPYTDEFKDVCKDVNNRWWAPSSFNSENYNIIPIIEENELFWNIYAHADPKTQVKVPMFIDAFKMVEKLENLIEHKIQQSQDN